MSVSRIARALACAGVLAVRVSAAHADAMDDGVAAMERGDFPAAIALWQPLAERGSVRAQFALGFVYYGAGPVRDYAAAARWFRAAAEQGDADAQDRLGMLYSLGRGVPQDTAEEFKWYAAAAAQSHPAAQFRLGYMYANARGVARDDIEAFKWYRLAAAQTSDPETRDAANKAQTALAATLTREQLREGNRRAHDWRGTPARAPRR